MLPRKENRFGILYLICLSCPSAQTECRNGQKGSVYLSIHLSFHVTIADLEFNYKLADQRQVRESIGIIIA